MVKSKKKKINTERMNHMHLASLQQIHQAESGDRSLLKNELWLKHLILTKENKVNLEHIESIHNLSANQTLRYVKRTLEILDTMDIPTTIKQTVEEVLKWSEVAKGGMPSVRKSWKKQGIDLYAHNIGSADIYRSLYPENRVVYILILTHGLIGQYLRGEVNLKENIPLTRLIEEEYFSKEELTELLKVLNQCIIEGVSKELWDSIQQDVFQVIEQIAEGDYEEIFLKEKIRRLRGSSIAKGENFKDLYEEFMSKEARKKLSALFSDTQLWYIEPALQDFSLEEFIKIFLLIEQHSAHKRFMRKHITLEPLMNTMYYDYQGKKKINLYKKRIIEKYLKSLSIDSILEGNTPKNKHVSLSVTFDWETIIFDFVFSPVGETLIDFCVEAEKADIEHEKAIILLFDLFELRRDAYDRFHNEDNYLAHMHSSADDKRIILDYIKGETILDVGPGSGVVMDMVEEAFPEKTVMGVDISTNIIETLMRKKQTENKQWKVYQADAMKLNESFSKGTVDTIIYSSIFHEFFSYIPHNGRKFNHETIQVALKSGFDVLEKGGRLIIRDGIMTEPVHEKRIIQFKNPKEDMLFLERYMKDFKGRTIQAEILTPDKVKMPINDAMEFLYTFTWGEESYVHEVNEQFGYFTPTGYKDAIAKTLGEENYELVAFKHYLQEGYTENLHQKIRFLDEQEQEVSLPDSTCLIVIEKK